MNDARRVNDGGRKMLRVVVVQAVDTVRRLRGRRKGRLHSRRRRRAGTNSAGSEKARERERVRW